MSTNNATSAPRAPLRLTSAKYLAKGFVENGTAPGVPERVNKQALAESLEGGLKAIEAASLMAAAGVAVKTARECPYVAYSLPDGIRRFGWLESDDGREATIRVDDLSVERVPTELVYRIDEDHATKTARLKARVQDAFRWTSDRQDVTVVGKPAPYGTAGEFEVKVAYQAARGLPSDTDVRRVLAAALPGSEYVDATLRRPGLLAAMVRVAASKAHKRRPSLLMEVEEPVAQQGVYARVAIKWKASEPEFKDLDDVGLKAAVCQRVERFIADNRLAFGMRGPFRIRLDLDVGRGRAIALVPCQRDAFAQGQIDLGKA